MTEDDKEALKEFLVGVMNVIVGLVIFILIVVLLSSI
jgi:hypothetical protein